MPAGWANYEDLVGQVLVVPSRGTLKGVNADTGDFIGVDHSFIAASAECNDTPAPAIGLRPVDIANWWRREPTAPRSVIIDGLRGLVADAHLSPSGPRLQVFGR